jgi:hypothetical protein
LLAEVRPYSFIIPPPYLAVNNDDDEKEKNEWNIIDEKMNDTDDDDDDAVQKRIMLFIYISISICTLDSLFIYSYFFFHVLVVNIFFSYILMVICVVEFHVFSQVNERFTRLLMLFNSNKICVALSYILAHCYRFLFLLKMISLWCICSFTGLWIFSYIHKTNNNSIFIL